MKKITLILLIILQAICMEAQTDDNHHIAQIESSLNQQKRLYKQMMNTIESLSKQTSSLEASQEETTLMIKDFSSRLDSAVQVFGEFFDLQHEIIMQNDRQLQQIKSENMLLYILVFICLLLVLGRIFQYRVLNKQFLKLNNSVTTSVHASLHEIKQSLQKVEKHLQKEVDKQPSDVKKKIEETLKSLLGKDKIKEQKKKKKKD